MVNRDEMLAQKSTYTIDSLIQKILNDEKQYDLSKIVSAYELAEKFHHDQKRESGEPYISHPLAVSYILLELGMDTDTICAALLHDVGKIGVADAIINKPGRLTDEEFAEMKRHPVIGSEILSEISEIPDIMVGARWHHEKYDGTGYPDHMKGEDISEVSRIIAVADAYDAMTSNRSYRDCLDQKIVREEIERGIGKQFDPQFAEIMLRIIDEDTDYQLHEF